MRTAFLIAAGVGLSLTSCAGHLNTTRAERLETLANAERAFARANVERGQRAAWLEWFAPDGVMFRAAGPVNAREFMGGNPTPPPAPPGAFDWRPTYGDISRSGDLGYSAGPVRVATAGRSDRFYFSVWRRQPDGAWRVILDLGTPVAPPGRDPFDDPYVPATAPSGRAPATGDDLGRLDRGPFDDATSLGALLDREVRGLRFGEAPTVGHEAFLQALARKPGSLALETLGVGTSHADDLGYTYGRYLIGAPTGERGYYARAWRRDGTGTWRIVFDVARPESTLR